MLVWFAVIAPLGTWQIANDPSVLKAVNPVYIVHFFAAHPGTAFVTLGAIVLVVTGGEALYADIGQGALLLKDPSAIESPFFRLSPTWGTVPLVIIATSAAVIAVIFHAAKPSFPGCFR